jgi:hypothetical protein
MMLASATASPPAFVDKTKVHPLRPNNGKGQPGPEEPEEDDTRSDAGLFGGSGGCSMVYHSLANGEGAPVILGTPVRTLLSSLFTVVASSAAAVHPASACQHHALGCCKTDTALDSWL